MKKLKATIGRKGRKRGPSIITLFRKAKELLDGEPTGSVAIIEGYKFRRTRPDQITFEVGEKK